MALGLGASMHMYVDYYSADLCLVIYILHFQVIMESSNSGSAERENPTRPPRNGPQLIVLSGKSRSALKQRISQFEVYLAQSSKERRDIAYTMCQRREHLKYRAFAVVEGQGSISFSGIEESFPSSPRLAFVFTGQGAQWTGMANDLLLFSECFRNSINKLDRTLQCLPDPPEWKIAGMFFLPDLGVLSRLLLLANV